MLLNAIVIDDEPKNIRLLKIMTAELLPTINIIGESTTLTEGVQLVKTLKPHIVFLDIRISEEDDGFKFFNAFKQPADFEVIFVTAHEEFIRRAFNQTFASGYILKPIDPKELVDVVYKAKQKLLSNTLSKQQNDDLNKYNEVLYCFIKDKVIKMKLLDGKEKVGTFNRLDDYENVPFFFRINRQCILNINYVKNINDTDHNGLKTRSATTVLLNGEVFTIAYSRKKAFLKMYEKLFSK